MDFHPGQEVTYLHTHPRGWNWIIPCRATVERLGKKRVGIRIERQRGQSVLRWVKPENLVSRP